MEKYHRIIFKISGEALKGKQTEYIFDGAMVSDLAKVIKEYVHLGLEVGIVVGAGNIWRGKLSNILGISSIDGDYMGMLGTVINALALKHVLEKEGVSAEVLSAIPVSNLVPAYDAELANRLLNEKKVVVFAAGTGKPQFTTDTCAALRAIDINADVILMAKDGVEGVYTADPFVDKNAKLIKNTTYDELLNLHVKVMDEKALELLSKTNIDTIVFKMNDLGNFLKVLKDDTIGTHIKRGK
jgi:uridylate kinase